MHRHKWIPFYHRWSLVICSDCSQLFFQAGCIFDILPTNPFVWYSLPETTLWALYSIYCPLLFLNCSLLTEHIHTVVMPCIPVLLYIDHVPMLSPVSAINHLRLSVYIATSSETLNKRKHFVPVISALDSWWNSHEKRRPPVLFVRQ